MQSNESLFKRLYPVILLTGVILISVVLLSFTNSYTSVLIDQQAKEILRSQLKVIFPDMDNFTEQNGVYILKGSNDQTVGYAFSAIGTGYGGKIEILVAMEDAETVKAISIVSQTETSGLGSRITLPRFTDQFAGKKVDEIKLRSEGGAIDGFTGSTVSSRAAVNAVRETALEKVGQLPR